jgi:hypothetical protein
MCAFYALPAFTHYTSGFKVIGSFLTLEGCLMSQLNSDIIYLELMSDPIS